MAEKQFPLSVVIRAIDRVTAPMGRIQRGVLAFDQRLRGRLSALGGRMSAFGARASDRLGLPVMGAAVGRLGSALGTLGKRVAILGGAVGAAIAGATTAAIAMVQSFSEVGGRFNDLSNQVGASVENLQAWEYAAAQNGLQGEMFDQSMRTLAKNIGSAAAGTGPAVKIVKALGLSLKDAHGNAVPLDDLLPRLADKLQKVKNPSVQASIAAKLFGDAGVRMLPFLKDGSKGLAEYTERARRLGIVLSRETIAQADEFGDKFDDLKLSITGARNIIGTALLPVLTQLVDKLTEFIIAQGPRLKAFFEDFAAKLPGRLKQLRDGFQKVMDKLQPVIDAVGWLVDKFGAANVIIGALAAVLIITLVPAIAATASAFYALGLAILATPVGWVLSLGAAAFLVYKNWDTVWAWLSALIGDNLFQPWFDALDRAKQLAGDVWDGIKKSFRGGIDSIVQWIKDVAAKIGNFMPDWVKRLFGAGGGNVSVNATGSVGAAPAGRSVGARAAAAGVAAPGGQARVQVDFTNLPRGTRVSSETTGRPDFELNQGYAMGMP